MVAGERVSLGVRSDRDPNPDLHLTPQARRDFAVIIPAYDEAESIPDLIQELKATFTRYQLEGEIVLIDDGSTDGTAEIAERERGGGKNSPVFPPPPTLGRPKRRSTAAGPPPAAAPSPSMPAPRHPPGGFPTSRPR